jgi:hypothetical protein
MSGNGDQTQQTDGDDETTTVTVTWVPDPEAPASEDTEGVELPITGQ